jgi:hypothetical protein
LVERLVWDQEVAGSNPVAPIFFAQDENLRFDRPRGSASLGEAKFAEPGHGRDNPVAPIFFAQDENLRFDRPRGSASLVEAELAVPHAGRDTPTGLIFPMPSRPPGFLQMLQGFLRGLAREKAAAWRGDPEMPAAEIVRRRALCHSNTCGQYAALDDRCFACGCNVEKKIAWRTASCPDGHWLALAPPRLDSAPHS